MFLSGISFETEDSYTKIPFSFPLNDVFAILSLARIYIVFRTLMMSTSYMNNRCKLMV